jgi:tetratricopeptide (TPR) repeat protein
MNSIEKLIENASYDMFNPKLNFEIANKYEELQQTASAVSFYLRSAEYGYDTEPEIVYTSLLKMAYCFDDQAGREHSVTHALFQAIQYMPTRPEAYFLLSRFYEKDQKWQQCYTFAEIGLLYSKVNSKLPIWVDYPGEYGLIFEKAVSGWWLGKKDESINIFETLLDKYEMNEEYINVCIYNLKKIKEL